MERHSLSTPSLVRLSFYKNLITNKVAKDAVCDKYLAPWNVKEGNCSVNGYLMLKQRSLSACAEEPPQQPGIPFIVEVDEAHFTLNTFSRELSIEERKKALADLGLPKQMWRLCVIKKAPGQKSITWGNFKDELVAQTDWFTISDAGMLFIRYCNDGEEGAKVHGLPYGGALQRPYLFVILVCSNGKIRGLGSRLLRVAEIVAQELGVEHVVLAALPGVAGFYYNRHGYKFIDRLGSIVDVSAWTTNRELPHVISSDHWTHDGELPPDPLTPNSHLLHELEKNYYFLPQE